MTVPARGCHPTALAAFRQFSRIPFCLALTTALVLFASIAAVGFGAPQQSQTAPAGTSSSALRTIWDGVYTDEQATRGQQSYKETCGYCHRDNLTGGGSEDGAPALKGSIFITRWKDKALSDLFVTIGTRMPYNKPDTLTPDEVADILAYLLQQNDLPPGQVELPGNIAALEQIMFTVNR